MTDRVSVIAQMAVVLYEGFHATETERKVAEPSYRPMPFTRAEAVAEAMAFYDEASRQVREVYAPTSRALCHCEGYPDGNCPDHG